MGEDHFRILLIEDDEDDYFLVKSLLSQARHATYHIDWTSNYEEGLSSLCGAGYDACLLDYLLGERNGLEFLREAIGMGCAVPIILLTGQGSADLDSEALRAGAADYLAKDLIGKELLERSIRYSVAHKRTETRLRKRTAELALANAALRLDEMRLQALWELRQMHGASEEDIASFVLDQLVKITGSQFGMFGFVDETQSVLTSHTWSKTVSRVASFQQTGWPVDEAGIWAEAITAKQPVMTNSFESPGASRAPCPLGHVPIYRVMSVPLFDDEKIVAVAAAANKDGNYDESDVRQVSLLLDGMWQHIKQVRSEKALRDSEERFRFIVETTGDVIYRLRYDTMNYDYLSPGIGKLTGYSPEEIKTIGLSSLITRLDLPGQEDVSAKVILGDRLAGKTGEYRADYLIITKTGTSKWLRDHSFPWYDDSGKNIGSVGILSDSTDYKQAEQELRRHREHLEEMIEERTAELVVAKARAEAADHVKSVFLATMSHELRTPLNSIIGFTKLLEQERSGPLNMKQKKQLGAVRESGSHLLNLINDILDISKIEAGQLEVSRESFDLRALIERVTLATRPLSEEKCLELEVEIAEDVNSISSDRRRVEQILLNLLSNAIKFTDKGKIYVCCSMQGRDVSVSVTDTGIGIKSEDMDRLFKPFQQVQTGAGRQFQGSGLGLSICKKLLDLLGGGIEVHSEWGKGSTFSFTIPVERLKE